MKPIRGRSLGDFVLSFDQVIHLLEEIARDDLETCATAIEAADKAAGLGSLERAFAKLDTAIDLLRNHGAFGRER